MKCCKLKREELKEVEKIATEDLDLDRAEEASEKIKELKEKQILLRNFLIIEENQRAFEDLKNLNREQVQEFNQKWDSMIEEMYEYARNIEQDIIDQHHRARVLLEQELTKLEIPEPKLTSKLLNQKFKLKKLIKQRNYKKAKEMKFDLDEKIQQERLQWMEKFEKKLQKRRDILSKQQNNEYEALKNRLEKSIDLKLKQKDIEFVQLKKRIQNLQNELIIKQSLQFSKIQASNSKILAKYNLNLQTLHDKFMKTQDLSKFFHKTIDKSVVSRVTKSKKMSAFKENNFNTLSRSKNTKKTQQLIKKIILPKSNKKKVTKENETPSSILNFGKLKQRLNITNFQQRSETEESESSYESESNSETDSEAD